MIADIADDALIGLDILNSRNEKPADIILSRNIVVLKSQEIPLVRMEKYEVRRVRVADHFMIEPMTEMIIDVLIDRRESDDNMVTCDVIIEPTEIFQEKHHLVVAPSLADLKHNVTAKVRIMNPYQTPVSMKQDTILGIAEDVSSDAINKTILKIEDENEVKNTNRVRRIMLNTSFESAFLNTNANHILTRKTSVKSTGSHGEKINQLEILKRTVPEHLQKRFFDSVKGKNVAIQTELSKLLIEYDDTFSKDETILVGRI